MNERFCLNYTCFDPFSLDDIEKLLNYLVSLLQNPQNNETRINEVIEKMENGDFLKFYKLAHGKENALWPVSTDYTIEMIIRNISICFGKLLLDAYRESRKTFIKLTLCFPFMAIKFYVDEISPDTKKINKLKNTLEKLENSTL